MKNTLSTALFVCSLAWCMGGVCEEKQLDPGVINGWMRSAVFSDSDTTETMRVVHSKSMKDWESSTSTDHVKYEVTSADCKRTLTFYLTNEHGQSHFGEWEKLIEDDQQRESKQLESPKVFARAYRYHALVGEFPIMDLDVEYQIRDGLPVLIAANQQDVTRVVQEFKGADTATVRISAFETAYSFRLNLDGFADKAKWSEFHCADNDTEETRIDKDSVLVPASS